MGGEYVPGVCPVCFGAGEVVVDATVRRGAFGQLQFLPSSVVTKPCQECGGSGRVAEAQRVRGDAVSGTLDVMGTDGEWHAVEGLK